MGTAAIVERVYYTVGTLVVAIFKAKSKHLIWRGSASDYLSNKAEKNQETLEKALK